MYENELAQMKRFGMESPYGPISEGISDFEEDKPEEKVEQVATPATNFYFLDK